MESRRLANVEMLLRAIGIVAAIVLLLAAPACTLAAQDAGARLDQLHSQAQADEAAGRIPQAEQAYREIVRLAPDLPAAHNNLGRLYYQHGQFDQAIPELERACKLDPRLEAPRALLGFSYYQMRQFDRARDQLKLAAALNPKDKVVRLFLARRYLETGDLKRSEQLLEELRKDDPRNPEVLFTLGSVYSGLAEGALEDIQSAAPNSYLIEVLLAKVEEAKGFYSQAADHYKNAIARAPQVAELYYQYGHALWASKNDAAALQAYRHALALNPYDYRASWEIARIVLPQDPAEAIRLVTAALQLDPDLPEALKIRGQALLATSHPQQAIDDLKKSVALDPRDATTHYQLARAYREAGMPAQAKEEDAAFLQLQSVGPASPAEKHP